MIRCFRHEEVICQDALTGSEGGFVGHGMYLKLPRSMEGFFECWGLVKTEHEKQDNNVQIHDQEQYCVCAVHNTRGGVHSICKLTASEA